MDQPSSEPTTASPLPPADRASVTLIVPPDPAMARVARLTASALAAGVGLDVDAVDDVKIAVSEMLALLLGRGGTGPVTLVFSAAPGGLRIEAASEVPPFGGDDQELELTDLVLNAVTASHETSHDGATARIVASVLSRDT